MNKKKSDLHVVKDPPVSDAELPVETSTEEVASDKPEDQKSILDENGEYPEEYVQQLIKDIAARNPVFPMDTIVIVPPIEEIKTASGIIIPVGLLSDNDKKGRYMKYHRVLAVGKFNGDKSEEYVPGKHSIWLRPGGQVYKTEIAGKLVSVLSRYDALYAVEYATLKKQDIQSS